jgi:hypothetical protein
MIFFDVVQVVPIVGFDVDVRTAEASMIFSERALRYLIRDGKETVHLGHGVVMTRPSSRQ